MPPAGRRVGVLNPEPVFVDERCAQPVNRAPRRYSTTASIVRAPRATATDTR